MCLCVWCGRTCGDQRTTCGLLLLPLWGFQGFALCHQPWQQVPLPAETSHRPIKKNHSWAILNCHLLSTKSPHPRRKEGIVNSLNLEGTSDFFLKNWWNQTIKNCVVCPFKTNLKKDFQGIPWPSSPLSFCAHQNQAKEPAKFCDTSHLSGCHALKQGWRLGQN